MARFTHELTSRIKALISAGLIGLVLAFAIAASATAASNQSGVFQAETELTFIRQLTPEIVGQWHQLRRQSFNPH